MNQIIYEGDFSQDIHDAPNILSNIEKFAKERGLASAEWTEWEIRSDLDATEGKSEDRPPESLLLRVATSGSSDTLESLIAAAFGHTFWSQKNAGLQERIRKDFKGVFTHHFWSLVGEVDAKNETN